MKRHPGDHSYTAYPGPAAAERRMRAVRTTDRPNYAAMTDQLWMDAWEAPHRDGRGPLAYALDTTAGYAARKLPSRTP